MVEPTGAFSRPLKACWVLVLIPPDAIKVELHSVASLKKPSGSVVAEASPASS